MSHETETEFEDLARALRENRPTPEPEFTDRLDRIVSDHFPPEWTEEVSLDRKHQGRVGSFAERLRRRLDGSRAILPTLAGAVGVLFVLAVVVTGTTGGPGNDGGDTQMSDSSNVAQKPAASGAGVTYGGVTEDSAADISAPEPERLDSIARKTTAGSADLAAVPGGSRQRDVALEAEITLGTDPEGVQDVANEIVAVTDEHNGIVMDSSVKDGEQGQAGASFSLLIPTSQIESAVADFSGIADLRSRSQELTDITAPTNRTVDNVADSKAKIKSLLGELEAAPDEATRDQLENQIRYERSDLAFYESRLKRLERRADYTPVALRVETGGDTSSDDESSGWGIADAVDDAGKLLGVAAGVTVLALAVAIPIGIVVLIALAMNRAWVRRSRRRVLADDA